jgi:hypothetical protein
VSIILERNINYSWNFEIECHLLKIECNEFSFTKNIESINIIYYFSLSNARDTTNFTIKCLQTDMTLT